MTIVKRNYNRISINELTCTFDTKQIRSEIEGMYESEVQFILPDKYTFEVVPSQLYGKVAKIKLKYKVRIKTADEILTEVMEESPYNAEFSLSRPYILIAMEKFANQADTFYCANKNRDSCDAKGQCLDCMLTEQNKENEDTV